MAPLLGYLIGAGLSLAVPPTPITVPMPPIQNVGTDVPILAKGIISWTFWGLIILAVIMFIVGAYRYVTSGGEPEKVSSANKTLLYAAIAVAVAIVAAGVPSIISTFLGGPFIMIWPF